MGVCLAYGACKRFVSGKFWWWVSLKADRFVPSDEVLLEQSYLVARGVRSLALVGECPADSKTMIRVATRIELVGGLGVVPFVVDHGSGVATFGYASAGWAVDLYEWSNGETLVPEEQRHRINGLLLGYSATAISRHDDESGGRRFARLARRLDETPATRLVTRGTRRERVSVTQRDLPAMARTRVDARPGAFVPRAVHLVPLSVVICLLSQAVLTSKQALRTVVGVRTTCKDRFASCRRLFRCRAAWAVTRAAVLTWRPSSCRGLASSGRTRLLQANRPARPGPKHDR
jgi:hypothetical protein